MKIEETKKGFVPIVLTLETREEFEFLFGLTMAAGSLEKAKCSNYSDNLNFKTFELLRKFE